MHAIVHGADIQDRDGGALLMATLFGAFSFLLKLYADGGYQGAEFQAAAQRTMAQVNIEIVKRSSDGVRGFVILPKRWLVERSFAWLNRCRRLAKDWGVSQPKGPRIPTARLNPAHAAKAMHSNMMFADRL